MNRLKQIIKVIVFVLFILPALFILNITNDIPLEELKEEFKKKNSRFVQVDGTFVHYVDQGDGTPLTLLYGQAPHFIPWIYGLRD